MERLILIDGHAIVYRAYHALSQMGFSTSFGLPTSAIYGFTKMLLDIITKFKPKYLGIAFDHQKPTFRHEIYSEYKANRSKPEDDFIIQVPYIFEIVKALEIPFFQMPSFEADDIIGTIAREAVKQNIEVSIITGDQDLLQLVNEKVKVLLPKNGISELKEYGINEAVERYELKNIGQIIDYRSLVGDKSDNIPGVYGIGAKTASKLLAEFDTLEKIYENIEQIKSKNVKEKLLNNKDSAFLSQRLIKIKTDVPINFDINKCFLNKPNEKILRELLEKLEFTSIIRSLPKLWESFQVFKAHKPENLSIFDNLITEESEKDKPIDLDLKIIDSFDKLDNLINELPYFSIDVETTGVNSLETNLVGIAISYDKNNLERIEKKVSNFKTFYIPVGHILELDSIRSLDIKETLSKLKPILENENILKIGHNIKFEINVFSIYGIKLKGLRDDTFISDYLLDPSKTHALKLISKSYLNYSMTPITDLISSGKNSITMDRVFTDVVAKYSGADASITLELSYFLREKLKEVEMLELYENIELPLVDVLARIEQAGVKIDRQHLKVLSKKLDDEIKILEKKVFELAGKEFNVNSPKQLSVILFEDLKLPTKGMKKSKTIGYSTDVNALETLAHEYEIAKHLLEFRQLSKLKSTYTDALVSLINKKTGRIHTSFNQTITTTGRLSSSEPNLQNIPIKSELGKEIRKAFIPTSSEHSILTADYSQIELRLLAHYSQDPNFIKAFSEDLDIHSITAMEIFGLNDISEVTQEQRRIGKTVNFGIVYGQTAYGLSESLHISNHEAHEIIQKFNNTYKNINKYVNETVIFAMDNSYVKTLFNRRRYLPEINSTNRFLREFAKRTAVNMPIQGTAADLIKIAMINIDKELSQRNLKTKMILQVHDELVFDVPKEEIEIVKELVKDIMENVYPDLKVPLTVSISVGDTWAVK